MSLSTPLKCSKGASTLAHAHSTEQEPYKTRYTERQALQVLPPDREEVQVEPVRVLFVLTFSLSL